MALKIAIGRKTANAIDGTGIDVRRGPGITVGVGKSGDVDVSVDPRPPVQIELQARRTLDGNILIMDHESIDIVMMPEAKKCLAFAKDVLHNDVYGAQDRLGSFLVKRGIIDASKIKSGNVFGSMEYMVLESKIPGVDQTQACLYTIYRYLQSEKPYFDLAGDHRDATQDHLLSPEDEHSTELGDVPQSTDKGGISSKVRPFGYQYNYSLIREALTED